MSETKLMPIPFTEVPDGAFFVIAEKPTRQWQKLSCGRKVAVDDRWNVLLIRDDVLCTITRP